MDDTQELNYAGICRAIAETDYPYYVGHEFKPKGDPIEALHDTFEMCDQGA
jgi:hydroxypyruvate isomerase